MTRTDDFADYVCCTSEGEEERTPEDEDDDDSDDERRALVLTENDDMGEEEEEEDVWKADDDLSLSTEIDSFGDESNEDTTPVMTEIAALRSEVRILKQTLAAQRLANNLLRRRVAAAAAGIHQERRNHGANARRCKSPPLQDELHHQDIPAKDRPRNLWRGDLEIPDATAQTIILSVCLTFLGYILLNDGGGVHTYVFFLKLFLCTRGLLCTIGRNWWVGNTIMERQEEPIDHTRLLLWVVLGIVKQPHNSSTTLLVALLASLSVDYASDMKHCIRMNHETVIASVDFMIKSFIEWETYTGLPLLVLIFLHESTLLPQAYAFLAMQTLVSIALQQQNHHHHVRYTPVMVLNAAAWGLYHLCGFWLYFAVVVGGFGVYAFQLDSTQRQKVTEAKKRD
jgi:hypothetical protein